MVSSKDFFPGCSESSPWKPHIIHKLREVHVPGKMELQERLLCTERLQRMQ